MESLLTQLAAEIVKLSDASKDDKIMDTDSAAAYIKADPATVRKLARANEIPHVKIGTHLRFHKDALDKWMGV